MPMTAPWDLAQQFIQGLQQQNAQTRDTTDRALLRMFAENVQRGNMGIEHGYNTDLLSQRHDFATQADTTAFERQLQRDRSAFEQQNARDATARRYALQDDATDFNQRAQLTVLEQQLLAQREALERGGVAGARRFGDFGPITASLSGTESGGNFAASNNVVGAGGKRGHFGRLQFGQARLAEAKAAGVIPPDMTPEQFMRDPDAQVRTEEWHFADINQNAAQRGLDKYIGQTIGGVLITPQSIQAMAHLGGIGGAEKFIKTGGQYNPSDANGTSLSDYGNAHGNANGGTSNEGRRSSSFSDSDVSGDILKTPVTSSAGDMNSEIPAVSPWMQKYLDENGLEPVRRVALTEKQLELLPPEFLSEHNLMPDIGDTSQMGVKGAKTEYIQVQPRAQSVENQNATGLPKQKETTAAPIELKEKPRSRYVDGKLIYDGAEIELPD